MKKPRKSVVKLATVNGLLRLVVLTDEMISLVIFQKSAQPCTSAATRGLALLFLCDKLFMPILRLKGG